MNLFSNLFPLQIRKRADEQTTPLPVAAPLPIPNIATQSTGPIPVSTSVPTAPALTPAIPTPQQQSQNVFTRLLQADPGSMVATDDRRLGLAGEFDITPEAAQQLGAAWIQHGPDTAREGIGEMASGALETVFPGNIHSGRPASGGPNQFGRGLSKTVSGVGTTIAPAAVAAIPSIGIKRFLADAVAGLGVETLISATADTLGSGENKDFWNGIAAATGALVGTRELRKLGSAAARKVAGVPDLDSPDAQLKALRQISQQFEGTEIGSRANAYIEELVQSQQQPEAVLRSGLGNIPSDKPRAASGELTMTMLRGLDPKQQKEFADTVKQVVAADPTAANRVVSFDEIQAEVANQIGDPNLAAQFTDADQAVKEAAHRVAINTRMKALGKRIGEIQTEMDAIQNDVGVLPGKIDEYKKLSAEFNDAHASMKTFVRAYTGSAHSAGLNLVSYRLISQDVHGQMYWLREAAKALNLPVNELPESVSKHIIDLAGRLENAKQTSAPAGAKDVPGTPPGTTSASPATPRAPSPKQGKTGPSTPTPLEEKAQAYLDRLIKTAGNLDDKIQGIEHEPGPRAISEEEMKQILAHPTYGPLIDQTKNLIQRYREQYRTSEFGSADAVQKRIASEKARIARELELLTNPDKAPATESEFDKQLAETKAREIELVNADPELVAARNEIETYWKSKGGREQLIEDYIAAKTRERANAGEFDDDNYKKLTPEEKALADKDPRMVQLRAEQRAKREADARARDKQKADYWKSPEGEAELLNFLIYRRLNQYLGGGPKKAKTAAATARAEQERKLKGKAESDPLVQEARDIRARELAAKTFSPERVQALKEQLRKALIRHAEGPVEQKYARRKLTDEEKAAVQQDPAVIEARRKQLQARLDELSDANAEDTIRQQYQDEVRRGVQQFIDKALDVHAGANDPNTALRDQIKQRKSDLRTGLAEEMDQFKRELISGELHGQYIQAEIAKAVESYKKKIAAAQTELALREAGVKADKPKKRSLLSDQDRLIIEHNPEVFKHSLELAQYIARLRTNGLTDFMIAQLRANPLSGSTILTNIGSNALNVLRNEFLNRPAAALVDKFISTSIGVGERARAYHPRDAVEAMKDTYKYLVQSNAVPEQTQYMLNRFELESVQQTRTALPKDQYAAWPVDPKGLAYIKDKARIVLGLGDKSANLIFNFMRAGDKPFKLFHFQTYLREEARVMAMNNPAWKTASKAEQNNMIEVSFRGLNTDTVLDAMTYADLMTWNNKNKISEAVSSTNARLTRAHNEGMDRWFSDFDVLGLAKAGAADVGKLGLNTSILFPKVPFNVAWEGISSLTYKPAKAAADYLAAARKRMMTATSDDGPYKLPPEQQRAMATAFAQSTSYGILLGSYFLASNGYLSTGTGDPAIDKATGNEPGVLHLGPASVKLSSLLGSLYTVAVTGVLIRKNELETGQKGFVDFLKALGQAHLSQDNPYIKPVVNVANMVGEVHRDGEIGPAVKGHVSNLSSNLVPMSGLLRTITGATESSAPYTPTRENIFTQMGQSALSILPGNLGNLPRDTDIFGNPAKRPGVIRNIPEPTDEVAVEILNLAKQVPGEQLKWLSAPRYTEQEDADTYLTRIKNTITGNTFSKEFGTDYPTSSMPYTDPKTGAGFDPRVFIRGGEGRPEPIDAAADRAERARFTASYGVPEKYAVTKDLSVGALPQRIRQTPEVGAAIRDAHFNLQRAAIATVLDETKKRSYPTTYSTAKSPTEKLQILSLFATKPLSKLADFIHSNQFLALPPADQIKAVQSKKAELLKELNDTLRYDVR